MNVYDYARDNILVDALVNPACITFLEQTHGCARESTVYSMLNNHFAVIIVFS